MGERNEIEFHTEFSDEKTAEQRGGAARSPRQRMGFGKSTARLAFAAHSFKIVAVELSEPATAVMSVRNWSSEGIWRWRNASQWF